MPTTHILFRIYGWSSEDEFHKRTMLWKLHFPILTLLRKKKCCLSEPPGILLWPNFFKNNMIWKLHSPFLTQLRKKSVVYPSHQGYFCEWISWKNMLRKLHSPFLTQLRKTVLTIRAIRDTFVTEFIENTCFEHCIPRS